MTAVLEADPDAIREAAKLLAAGRLVALPTETVYGLAAHAFDVAAIQKVFEAKERPRFDPLIVHVNADWDALNDTRLAALQGIIDIGRLGARARAHAERLASAWPGPLTLVLPKGDAVPDLATSGLDTVAVRAPSHPVARRVIDALGAPIVAPSANRFGRISPTTAQHVLEELDGRVPLILDGGPTPLGVESTIVGVEVDGVLRLLREGSTPRAEIEACVGAPLTAPTHRRDAPGMLASHYAPRKPLRLHDASCVPPKFDPVAWLLLGPPDERDWPGPPVHVEVLSQSHDSREAAQNLFAALRRLDASSAACILAETTERDDGLWPAIRDRLQRASADRS